MILDKEKEKKTVNEEKPLRSINITFQGQGKISTSKGAPPLLKLSDRAHKYFWINWRSPQQRMCWSQVNPVSLCHT